jgi:hypothetical protein
LDKYEQVVALWQSYKIKSTADLDKYLDSFRIRACMAAPVSIALLWNTYAGRSSKTHSLEC